MKRGDERRLRNICTKDPSTLLHGTCELITESEERKKAQEVKAEDLFLTRVQRTSMRYGGTSPSRHSPSVILTF